MQSWTPLKSKHVKKIYILACETGTQMASTNSSQSKSSRPGNEIITSLKLRSKRLPLRKNVLRDGHTNVPNNASGRLRKSRLRLAKAGSSKRARKSDVREVSAWLRERCVRFRQGAATNP